MEDPSADIKGSFTKFTENVIVVMIMMMVMMMMMYVVALKLPEA